jgi:hypothetical protein
MMLYFPIFQLSQATHSKYKKINLMELGFGTLIFMLDQMLSNKRKITNQTLTIFLKKTVEDIYNIVMTLEEANELRIYLVDTKLRNEGKKFSFKYTDYQTGEEKEELTDLIQYEDYSLKNIKENEIYLKLTPEAIELLFKTKEMFGELQISITMLYFKQQLKKGAYSEAFQTVKELLTQIDTQIEKFNNKMIKIKTNTLTEFNYEQISKDLEKSKEDTEREKDELNNLKEQVRQVRNNYQLMKLNKKEQQKMDQIEEIDKYLRKCMTSHESLFIKKQDFLATIKTSFELLIENMFSKAFHFEREIIDGWVDNRINQEVLSSILTPILPMKINKLYNPMEIFLPQKLINKKEVIVEEVVVLDEESIKKTYEEEQRVSAAREKIDSKIIRFMLEPLIMKESYYLSDAFKELREKDFGFYQDLQELYIPNLMELCVTLHQSDYKSFEMFSLEKIAVSPIIVQLLVKLTNKLNDLSDIDSFEIESTKGYIEFPNGAKITDIIIRRKGEQI